MRVLFASHTGDWSGAEVALMRLVAGLRDQHELAVACPASGRVAINVDAVGLRRYPLPPTDVSLRPHLLRTPVGLAKIVEAGIALRLAAAHYRADVVHEHLPHLLLANATRTVVARSAAAVVGVTAYTAANFNDSLEFPIAEHVYISIDHARFDPATVEPADLRAELGLSPSALLVGETAQITPWKGQDTAIRMIARMRESGVDTHLALIGDVAFKRKSTRFDNERYLAGLHELIQELQVGDFVHFLGHRQDTAALFAGLDLSVLPSWNEPFGTVAAESMAMGTPVMVGAVGGVPEYVEDGVTGRVLPPRRHEVWADAALELLADRDALDSMGRRARSAVARFTDSAYAEGIHAVYLRALERPTSTLYRRRAQATGQGSDTARDRRRAPRLPSVPPPTRVLIVEYTSLMSGGQHSLLELLSVLADDVEVQLACPDGELAVHARALGISVLPIAASQISFKVDLRHTPREILAFTAAARSVRRHVRRFGPDVVHANSVRAGLACILALPGRQPPLVIHCRDVLPADPAGRAVTRLLVGRATRVVAVSTYVAERLGGSHWAARGVRVVDNAVNLDRFDPRNTDAEALPRELGIDGGPILSVIGQLTSWKRQDHAVRVLARVRDRFPDAQLLIAGEAKFVSPSTRLDNHAYETELHGLVHSLGLERSVHFLGERGDPEQVLAATDVLLAPSSEEPFGRTLIEALAMEVPVVATNMAGPAEILRDGVDGRLAAADDLGDWASAVAELVERHTDGGARAYADWRFSPQVHARAMRAIYGEAIAAGMPAPASAP
jgi:glycosyltransferase involved in cell wall biosynthesis